MVQRMHVVVVDDIDGTEGAETVKFGLDGARYEIDLTDEHAAELRMALAPYIKVARKIGGAAKAPAAKPRKRKKSQDTAQIRKWAREHQIDVPDRGRIPKKVMEAYQSAA